MPMLNDLFTSLANKIRSKLGTTTKYTPNQAINAIDDVWTKAYNTGNSNGYSSGVSAARQGTASAADVLSGKTFTNSSSSNLSGSMPNKSVRDSSTPGVNSSYSTQPVWAGDPGSGQFLTNTDNVERYIVCPPKGYYPGEGKAYVGMPSQTKSCTPTTSAQTISPDSGKVLKSITVNAISTQTKSCTPTTSAQTISADSGKYLTSVSVGTQAHSGTYQYQIPVGSGSNLPDKYWDQFFNKTPYSIDLGATHANRYVQIFFSLDFLEVNRQYWETIVARCTETYTATSRGAALDMGEYNKNRYVNTNSVPNTNSGTYTFASGSTGAQVDLGATNTYRYVVATNVYNAGKAKGMLECGDSRKATTYNSSSNPVASAKITYSKAKAGPTVIISYSSTASAANTYTLKDGSAEIVGVSIYSTFLSGSSASSNFRLDIIPHLSAGNSIIIAANSNRNSVRIIELY